MAREVTVIQTEVVPRSTASIVFSNEPAIWRKPVEIGRSSA
jgi:hypothetical protein